MIILGEVNHNLVVEQARRSRKGGIVVLYVCWTCVLSRRIGRVYYLLETDLMNNLTYTVRLSWVG